MGVEPLSEHNLDEAESKGRNLLNGAFGNNLNLPVALQDQAYTDLSQREHVKGASLCVVEAGKLNK